MHCKGLDLSHSAASAETRVCTLLRAQAGWLSASFLGRHSCLWTTAEQVCSWDPGSLGSAVSPKLAGFPLWAWIPVSLLVPGEEDNLFLYCDWRVWGVGTKLWGWSCFRSCHGTGVCRLLLGAPTGMPSSGFIVGQDCSQTAGGSAWAKLQGSSAYALAAEPGRPVTQDMSGHDSSGTLGNGADGRTKARGEGVLWPGAQGSGCFQLCRQHHS